MHILSVINQNYSSTYKLFKTTKIRTLAVVILFEKTTSSRGNNHGLDLAGQPLLNSIGNGFIKKKTETIS